MRSTWWLVALTLTLGVGCEGVVFERGTWGAGSDAPPSDAPGPVTPQRPIDRDPGPNATTCADPQGGSPVRRLNKDELAHAIQDVYGVEAGALTALPQEGVFGGFSTVGSALDTGVLFTERYFDEVESMSVDVLAGLDRTCAPTSGMAGACGLEILGDRLRRLYRRDLTGEELSGLSRLMDAVAAEIDFDAALRAGVMVSLTSSSFLFVQPSKHEETTRAWTSEELATKLALALWRSVPDAALLDAASRGDLETREGLARELDRMMSDARFERFLDRMIEGWLGLGKLDQVDLDLDHYGLDASQWRALRRDMREETHRFIRHIYAQDLPIRELFTANYTFANQRLADHYGLDVTVEGFEKVDLPATSMRAGVLTQGAVLARSSSGDHVSVVARGNATLEGFLCQTFPDPPDAIADQVEAQGEAMELSEWDKVQARAENPTCAGCHNSIDPVGWSFASFDGLARWREADETGLTIEAQGRFQGQDFEGARGLVEMVLAGEDKRLESCMTSRLLVYTSNRVFDVQARVEDACLVDEILEAAAQGREQVSLRQLIRELFLSRAFRVQGPEIIEGAIKEEH